MLSPGKSKEEHCGKSRKFWKDLKHYNTDFVQIPPRTETRLLTECKHAADWHTRSIATCFHLSLLADERVELDLYRFDFGPPNPAKFNQLIQQLPKEVESRIIVISNDKQLSPCPIGERAANVERMVLKRSSRKRSQSTWKFLRRILLFIFSRDDNRPVPSKKYSSAIAPKHEWIGSMYASNFSITCKSLLRFTFCSKQYTNRESSPNER